MSLADKIRAIRDPDFRGNASSFDHPVGIVSENEIENVVGGAEVSPNSIRISIYKCLSLFCPSVAECLVTTPRDCGIEA
ncbi:hypothetical protein [Paenibacillus fonticola]|uniref:hypothetical protein n=1 Tax=Paenibacillus fonticola TaxID=379896 RepID=UPI00037AAE93|nr:hypothetical protein [Paenibacillus fonticola]